MDGFGRDADVELCVHAVVSFIKLIYLCSVTKDGPVDGTVREWAVK